MFCSSPTGTSERSISTYSISAILLSKKESVDCKAEDDEDNAWLAVKFESALAFSPETPTKP